MNPIHTSIVAITAAVSCLGSCAGVTQSQSTKPAADVLIFCGVNPATKDAWKLAQGLHDGTKAQATYGPCLKPDSSYTADVPGVRELDRNGYAALVELNAFAGMKTVVYDAGIWSQDPVFRQSVIDFWSQPSFYGGRLLDHIYGWNLGDEYNPDNPREWDALKARWATVTQYVTPVTGIAPMANQLGNARTIDQALADLPGADANLSFDMYLEDFGVGLAKQYDGRVKNLQCSVNAFDHTTHDVHLEPSPLKIEMQMSALRTAGCDSFLVFGGTMPEGTTEFGAISLLTTGGKPTTWATAVAKGARS